MQMDRFDRALQMFDEANAEDPNHETVDDVLVPKELIYGHRMSARLTVFAPDAPEALRLAARCQHLRRWEIPRESYPRDRTGYLRWRTELRKFHAQTAGQILHEVGYEPELVAQVQSLLRKENLRTNVDTQTLEDVICLVFLEYYFDPFIGQHAHEPDKIVDIVRKTWGKMSDQGHEAALALPLTERALAIVGKALG